MAFSLTLIQCHSSLPWSTVPYDTFFSIWRIIHPLLGLVKFSCTNQLFSLSRAVHAFLSKGTSKLHWLSGLPPYSLQMLPPLLMEVKNVKNSAHLRISTFSTVFYYTSLGIQMKERERGIKERKLKCSISLKKQQQMQGKRELHTHPGNERGSMAGRKFVWFSGQSKGAVQGWGQKKPRHRSKRAHLRREQVVQRGWGAAEGSSEQEMSLTMLTLEVSTKSVKKCRIQTQAYRIYIVTKFPGNSFAH